MRLRRVGVVDVVVVVLASDWRRGGGGCLRRGSGRCLRKVGVGVVEVVRVGVVVVEDVCVGWRMFASGCSSMSGVRRVGYW